MRPEPLQGVLGLVAATQTPVCHIRSTWSNARLQVKMTASLDVLRLLRVTRIPSLAFIS